MRKLIYNLILYGLILLGVLGCVLENWLMMYIFTGMEVGLLLLVLIDGGQNEHA